MKNKNLVNYQISVRIVFIISSFYNIYLLRFFLSSKFNNRIFPRVRNRIWIYCRSRVVQQLHGWMGDLLQCSIDGGAFTDRWYPRALDRNRISWSNVVLVNRLWWSKIYPFLRLQNISHFLLRCRNPRLVTSIICPSTLLSQLT